MDLEPTGHRLDELTVTLEGLHIGPFPDLPVELVSRIMEIAATESKPTALALALVSKAVNHWIIPILYRVVVLPDHHKVESFHAISEEKMKHVRNLSLFHGKPPICALEARMNFRIISLCRHVKRLHLGRAIAWVEPRDVDFDIAGPEPRPFPALTELMMGRSRNGALWGGLMWSPILQTVTHFYCDAHAFHWEIVEVQDVCQALCNLTHLGLRCESVYNSTISVVNHWLSSSPRLEVLLLHAWHKIHPGATAVSPWWGLADIDDERLFARFGIEHDHEEFCKSMESGETVWDNAREKFGEWREDVKAGGPDEECDDQ